MGAATARRFVREGANVTIADVDIVRAKDVAAELGANVLVVDLDVR
jgi:NAD(P)-dependent dehydrogenase (short-subunit alcohol dehydrogenase family)